MSFRDESWKYNDAPLWCDHQNEISQVKETNVHIPKGDSIPCLCAPFHPVHTTLKVYFVTSLKLQPTIMCRIRPTLIYIFPWFFKRKIQSLTQLSTKNNEKMFEWIILRDFRTMQIFLSFDFLLE